MALGSACALSHMGSHSSPVVCSTTTSYSGYSTEDLPYTGNGSEGLVESWPLMTFRDRQAHLWPGGFSSVRCTVKASHTQGSPLRLPIRHAICCQQTPGRLMVAVSGDNSLCIAGTWRSCLVSGMLSTSARSAWVLVVGLLFCLGSSDCHEACTAPGRSAGHRACCLCLPAARWQQLS